MHLLTITDTLAPHAEWAASLARRMANNYDSLVPTALLVVICLVVATAIPGFSRAIYYSLIIVLATIWHDYMIQMAFDWRQQQLFDQTSFDQTLPVATLYLNLVVRGLCLVPLLDLMYTTYMKQHRHPVETAGID